VGREGGGRGGRRVVEVVRGPVGKRRSIMTTRRPSLPMATSALARASIFFVFVVHTMSTMAGAMQFSRG
jgi:hypothetical protein